MEEKDVTIKIAPDVQVLCDIFGITPEALLTQYVSDLCSLATNGGSDERYMAKDYFLRSYLAREDEFTMSNAPAIMEDFEALYQNAYPALDNKGWQQQRTELLKELYRQWLANKESYKKSTYEHH